MEKKFDAASAEPRIYRDWEESGAFAAGANAKDGKERDKAFCVMIPPPNVTGVLHMGHAFNATLQDILVRWHRMRGFDTLWQPGQDHAGIATQMVVERELAKDPDNPSRRDMGREAFLERVWDWKRQSGGTIIEQFKRLGASCDWSRNAFTMSGAPGAPDGEEGNFHDAVLRVFVDMHEKGMIYRGKRLVNWDPNFETAISDLEVENIEVDGHMWHFKYPLSGGETYRYVEKDDEGNVVLEEERDYISIATTRPETMLGDGAVAVHPSDERYAPIVGKLCEIPVGPKEHRRLIPIIVDDYPDPEFGSGAVKITGAHDFNDYGVASRNDIPMYRLMDGRAHMRDDGAPYAEASATALAIARGERSLSPTEIDAVNLVPDDLRGLDRFEARERVVNQITEEGLAVTVPAPDSGTDGGTDEDRPEGGDGRNDRDDRGDRVPLVESKPIVQPFGDRSKVVIEPMLTDQWFVDTARIVEPALDAVRDGRISIVPESERKTYFHWLENIEPWCISRQLWWGHQVPVWYGPVKPNSGDATERDGGAPMPGAPVEHGDLVAFCAANFAAARDKAAEYYGDVPISESPSEDAARVAWDADEIALFRDPDVLDTWFSSGLWPIGTLGWPDQTGELERYFPTSILITGKDILFFWVARMIMMQLAVVGEVPFDRVYLHGLVRDAKGRKMSKSTGNVIDPLDLIDSYGADALRFANAAMASLGGALKLDTGRIQGYRNFGTKLWNAMRFAHMNGVFEAGSEREAGEDGPPGAEAAVNRWIVGETARVRVEVDEALEACRFNDAADALYAFVWGKVCDWYLEFAKPLFLGDDEAATRETRLVMNWVLDHCLKMLHPFMPFLTEELWSLSGKRDRMLVVADWPTAGPGIADAEADREMRWVISLVEEIRSARAQLGVPAGMKIPMLARGLDAGAESALERNGTLIERLARVEGITRTDSAFPRGTIAIAADGATFGLPLADVIDIDLERARLEKARDRLDGEIGGLGKRLGNPGFLASAPEEVVVETRETLASREDELAKTKEALARLSELEG